MKISTNKKELISLNACSDGLETFIAAHGENDALLSECLKSNGWSDVFWLLNEVSNQLSDEQKRDLRMLACDWAESVLHIFEIEYPNDDRPRLAINAARDYANGLIDLPALNDARAAAWTAAGAAWAAARAAAANAAAYAAANAAARAAVGDVAWTANAAARAAVGDVAKKEQTNDLMRLFLKWEQNDMALGGEL